MHACDEKFGLNLVKSGIIASLRSAKFDPHGRAKFNKTERKC
ncbi:hypothetical protein CSUNSWCD_1420 [Campylobacter showae CSUNSWCD]|uniref:Uncharacterized protein n=1 Tax=Campylobacter showae CSUNSWCD TaxID=1244083 RepID=M5INS5_9BACT|nr:hypothetical protein CSUNSWCD_1420 [Campylobacter showae CSUNSWCD]